MDFVRVGIVMVALAQAGCGGCSDDQQSIDAPRQIDAPAEGSDAQVSGAGGEALWAKQYGVSGDLTPIAIAVDSAGATLLVGELAGTANFAGTGAGGIEAITATAGSYMAKLDAGGNYAWSKPWTSTTSGVYGVTIAIGPSDSVVVAGQLFGTANLGGLDLTATGTYAAFVVKLDAQGNHVWSKAYDNGSGTLAYALSAAVDGNGDVIVVGQYSGSMNVGGMTLTSNGSRDYFVAKLGGSDGHTIWAHTYGDAADQSGIAVAVDHNTNAIDLIGRFAGSVDFGGGALTGNGNSGFVAQLDTNAAHNWSKLLATASPTSIASDAAGDIVYTGYFSGTVDFAGTGTAGSEILTAGAGTNVFVVKLATSGAHAYSRKFSSAGYLDSIGVGVTSTGDAAITGQFRNGGPLDFSAGGVAATPLTCAGARAFYTATLTAAGAHRWAFCIGTAGTYQEGEAVAVAPTGHVHVNGDFYMSATTSLAFVKAGGGTITVPRMADTDGFIAKLAP